MKTIKEGIEEWMNERRIEKKEVMNNEKIWHVNENGNEWKNMKNERKRKKKKKN